MTAVSRGRKRVNLVAVLRGSADLRSRGAKARLQRPGDGGKVQSASEERSHASVPVHSWQGGQERGAWVWGVTGGQGLRVQADLVKQKGREEVGPPKAVLLAEGRATGNYRMYDHSVAQAATDRHPPSACEKLRLAPRPSSAQQITTIKDCYTYTRT